MNNPDVKNVYDEMLRAPDMDTMYAAFERFGLVRRDDDGLLTPVPGVHISGQIHIEGDDRYHCDILITPPVDMENAAHVFGLWESNGTPGDTNKGESSLDFYGVELINRASVKTPAHRWAR